VSVSETEVARVPPTETKTIEAGDLPNHSDNTDPGDDQSDSGFLEELAAAVGSIDVLSLLSGSDSESLSDQLGILPAVGPLTSTQTTLAAGGLLLLVVITL